MSFWLQNLNPEQQDAVLHDHGPLLILAGAGSGKTTVLVSRTGRLIAEGLTRPERVCVLTFTNKAAQELKIRVSRKLGAGADKVWAGTFHGFGLQFLKEHWREAELPRKFGIIDGGDALSILKDLLRDHRALEKDRFDVEKLMSKIGRLRETQRESSLDDTIESAMAVTLAPKFVRRLRHLGVVDFEDLLLRPLKMMNENSRLREKMQARFDFVMVDEFQDTNATQMLFIDQLTAGHRNVAVVGDDDQSIYGWRGAEISNILGFPQRYQGTKVIRLERNYRSSPTILNLANAIISTNKKRHGKVLRPGLDREGEPPELFVYENENEEVDQVVGELTEFHRQGYRWRDIAILYRSNSQGGLIEGGLRRAQIPYKLTGGTALFDRKEAKDALAFIRSSLHPTEVSFRRVINLPPRGVGEKTLDAIEAVTTPVDFHQKARLWAKAHDGEAASGGITKFFEFLEEMKSQLVHSPLDAEDVLVSEMRRLGYRDYVNQSYRDPAGGRAALAQRDHPGPHPERHVRSPRPVAGHAGALRRLHGAARLRFRGRRRRRRSGADDDPAPRARVLEFPLVFLLGLEEDLLPHARLGGDVDEERRLFYVGVTPREETPGADPHARAQTLRPRAGGGAVALSAGARFQTVRRIPARSTLAHRPARTNAGRADGQLGKKIAAREAAD